MALVREGSWPRSRPLGTVVRRSRREAGAAAAARWPGVTADRLRVVPVSAVPADLLGRALALDALPRVRI